MDKSSLILYLRRSSNSPNVNPIEMHERIELQSVPSITSPGLVNVPLMNENESIKTDESNGQSPPQKIRGKFVAHGSRPLIIAAEECGAKGADPILQEGTSCLSIVDELNPLPPVLRKSRHRTKDGKRRHHRRHRRSKGLKSDAGVNGSAELADGVNIEHATPCDVKESRKKSRNLRKTHIRGIDEVTAGLIQRDSLRTTVTSATDGLTGVVGEHPARGDLTKKKSPLVEMIIAGLIMLAGTGTLLMSVVLGGEVGTIVGSSCMGIGLLLMIIGVCWYLSKTQDTQDQEGRLDVRVIDARLLADLIKRGVQVRQV